MTISSMRTKSRSNRIALKNLLALEQPVPGDFSPHFVAMCVWCGLPGGDGPYPPRELLRRYGAELRSAWGPLDMHEWHFKRSSGKPDEVIFQLWNVVLAHHKCHMEYGQTRAFYEKCYAHKAYVYGEKRLLNMMRGVCDD